MERNGTVTDVDQRYYITDKMGLGARVYFMCWGFIDGPICDVSPLPHYLCPVNRTF